MTNPYEDIERTAHEATHGSLVALGTVDSVLPEGHAALVDLDDTDDGDPVTAFVTEQRSGDASLPSEGDRVVVQPLSNDTAILHGVVYGDADDVPNTTERQLSGFSPSGAVSVEDDGTTVLDDTTGINFASKLSVTDDGDDTVTVDVESNDAIVASGTHTVDSSDGSEDEKETVLSLPKDGNYMVSGYPVNPSNIDPDENSFHVQLAFGHVLLFIRYETTDDSWVVTTQASSGDTTGPVDVEWFVYDLDVLNSTGGGESTLGGGEKTGVFSRSDIEPTPQSEVSLRDSDTYSVTTDGNYIYFYDFGDPSGDGTNSDILSIYDISDPANPTVASETEFGHFHTDMVVQGDYLYTVNFGNHLRIYDVSDRTSPTLVGDLSVFRDAVGVSVDATGSTVYVADNADKLVYTVDVSDKTAPSVTAQVGVDDDAAPSPTFIAEHDGLVYYRGDFNDNHDAIRVLDVSDPSDPTPIGMTGSSQALEMALAHDMDYDGGTSITVAGESNVNLSNGVYHISTADFQSLAEAASGDGGGSAISSKLQDDYEFTVYNGSELAYVQNRTLADLAARDGLNKRVAGNESNFSTFERPLVYDGDTGAVYLNDANGLTRWNGDGTKEYTVSLSNLESGIAVDSGSQVYVVRVDSGNSNTTLLARNKSDGTAVWSTTYDSNNADGNAVSVGPNGNIWIANQAANEIYEFDQNGNIVTTLSNTGGQYRLTTGPNYFYTVDGTDVYQYDYTATQTGSITDPFGDGVAYGITVDADDNVYVRGDNGGIAKYDSSLSEVWSVEHGHFEEDIYAHPSGLMVYRDPLGNDAVDEITKLDAEDGSDLYGLNRYFLSGELTIATSAGRPAVFTSNW